MHSLTGDRRTDRLDGVLEGNAIRSHVSPSWPVASCLSTTRARGPYRRPWSTVLLGSAIGLTVCLLPRPPSPLDGIARVARGRQRPARSPARAGRAHEADETKANAPRVVAPDRRPCPPMQSCRAGVRSSRPRGDPDRAPDEGPTAAAAKRFGIESQVNHRPSRCRRSSPAAQQPPGSSYRGTQTVAAAGRAAVPTERQPRTATAQQPTRAALAG